jgi:hypothetical protein
MAAVGLKQHFGEDITVSATRLDPSLFTDIFIHGTYKKGNRRGTNTG